MEGRKRERPVAKELAPQWAALTTPPPPPVPPILDPIIIVPTVEVFERNPKILPRKAGGSFVPSRKRRDDN